MPLKRLCSEIDVRAGVERPPLLSVSIHRGVVPRSELTDDEPRADDLANYKVCEADDLVLNRMRAFQGAIGVSDHRGLVSPDYLVLRPEPQAYARYLHYAFRSAWFVGEMTARIRGIGSTESGVVRTPRINAADLLEIELDLPRVEQQRRIADFLDDQVARIDNIIAARREQTTHIEEARRSQIVSLVLAGGDLHGTPETAWYRGLPVAWPVRPLRAAWEVVDCKHRTPTYIDDGYPLVSPGDIAAAPLDLKRCHRFVDQADFADLADDLRRCRIGDIVYSRNASAGTAALVTTAAPFTMGQDVCRITSKRRSQEYLYYVLNFAVVPQLDAARIGSTFTRINVDEIKSLRVPVPADREQERIVREVGAVAAENDALSAAQTTQIELLQDFKRSLITAAVTGEFDVSSASGRYGE